MISSNVAETDYERNGDYLIIGMTKISNVKHNSFNLFG